MDKNTDRKTEIIEQTSKSSPMTDILELQEEYEKLMAKEDRSYDPDYEVAPAAEHIDYVNA